MKQIPLMSREGHIVAFTKVDDDDYGRVSQHVWRLHRAGRGYAHRYSGNSHIFLHREIMGISVGRVPEVDHIDGDGLNNQRGNLRLVSHSQNHQNRRATRVGTSRYRGVAVSRDRWRAFGKLNGVKYHLGMFHSEDEAGTVAAKWRAEHMPFSLEALVTT